MKVFISWSGDKSKEIAEVLKDWLPAVIQAVKPYFSPVDVEKGARWGAEIVNELAQSKVGLICLTKSNLVAPWIMFEAGALAKSIDKSRVVPLLFGVVPSELVGPLAQFQAANFSKQDTKKLLKTINSALGEHSLELAVLDSVFEKWWPDIEAKISKIMREPDSATESPVRSEREILEEILGLIRSQVYETDTPYSILLRPLVELNLSEETEFSLKAENIFYIGDLAQWTAEDLLARTKIKKGAIVEIRNKLAAKGIILGTPIPDWPPRSLR